MAAFTVVGPIRVPLVIGKGGRYIDKDALDGFWDDAGCGDKPGCYVFAIRTGRASLPYYAGRTTKTLKGECFTSHKMGKYHTVLVDIKKGTPLMYFVVPVVARGRQNSTAIKALEERLIGLGLQRNPKLKNIQKAKKDELVIQGVIGGKPGKPTASATSFREMIGL